MPLGRHILAELHGVSAAILNDPSGLERALVETAQQSGATVVDSTFNPFAPHGVTGFVIIQESHLAIHTWPEHGYAALDVFTCGSRIDPAALCRAFADRVAAGQADLTEIERGAGVTTAESAKPPALADRGGAARRSIWFTDRQDNIALSLRHAGLLFSEQSPFQRVEVLDSAGYGKILLLDQTVAFTEADEFVYHELIAHIPVACHGAPRRVLVLGGGDGGACRELLKHPNIQSITVIERDETVTRAARGHFPDLASALDDARVSVRHADGVSALRDLEPAWDLILVDFYEPSTAGSVYRAAARALAPDGLLVTQVPPPALSIADFRDAVANLASVLGSAKPYLGYLPTYSTGTVSFIVAGSTCPPPRPFAADLQLSYLNDDIAKAAFALPNFIQPEQGA